MKGTRVNPTALSPMEMNNMSSMMGMMNSIQKIGKGKNLTKTGGGRSFTIWETLRNFLLDSLMRLRNNFLIQLLTVNMQEYIIF